MLVVVQTLMVMWFCPGAVLFVVVVQTLMVMWFCPGAVLFLVVVQTLMVMWFCPGAVLFLGASGEERGQQQQRVTTAGAEHHQGGIQTVPPGQVKGQSLTLMSVVLGWMVYSLLW